MTTEAWVSQHVRKIDLELAHARSERDRLTVELKECDKRIDTLEARKRDEEARR